VLKSPGKVSLIVAIILNISREYLRNESFNYGIMRSLIIRGEKTLDE